MHLVVHVGDLHLIQFVAVGGAGGDGGGGSHLRRDSCALGALSSSEDTVVIAVARCPPSVRVSHLHHLVELLHLLSLAHFG